MADDPDSLIVWALSTFHTALLVAALITLLYVSAPLGNLLQGLNTALGLVLYLVLWATTWGATRAVLQRTSVMEDATLTSVFAQSLLWGAVTGVVFLLSIVLLVVVPQLLFRAELTSLAFIIGVGSMVALVIGALVGGVFALLDILLFRLTELAITN